MENKLLLWCLMLCSVHVVKGQCPVNQDCIVVRSCPSILEILSQNPVPPGEIERIKNAQCGYDYALNQPQVCCPRVEQPILAPQGDIKSNLLPDADVCGSDPSKRIVGGQLTLLRQFPWVALLEYQKPEGRGFHCGGSLINNNYVITAAHCILRIPKTWRLVSVRLGEHQLDKDPDCDDEDRPGFEDCADSPIDVPVGSVSVHPEYVNRVGSPNDIALIRLSRSVTYTQSIQPICMPTSKDFATTDFTGTSMVVTGFGRTETRGQSNIKLKVEVPIKPKSECVPLYKKNGVTLIDTQFCAGGNKGEDSCTGDSGGPLMYLRQTETEYNWYLYGIVSFGPIQCGAKDFPGIYTNVNKFMPWVVSNMKP
ncbi:hypothetical protein FQR65_LT02003 [Abscondita terminalis]|nr:hypothetical protein FQR65_LT02003 [Abscondita terminalis]